MSCCSGCQSGMGCCESSGLSGLYGLDNLMGNLMGALIASGSRVRAGVEYQSAASIAEHNEGLDSAAHIQEVLTGAMLGSGVYKDAFVQVKEPGWFGYQNGYITTVGTLYTDVADPYQIKTLITGLIQDYLPVLRVTRQDEVAIDYVPPEAAGRPNVQQVYDPSQQQMQQSLPGQPGQPSKCAGMSPGNWIACQLGIESPLGGVAAGTVGALLAVGLGTLVLVAVLRR